jgi:hypothetical protein
MNLNNDGCSHPLSLFCLTLSDPILARTYHVSTSVPFRSVWLLYLPYQALTQSISSFHLLSAISNPHYFITVLYLLRHHSFRFSSGSLFCVTVLFASFSYGSLLLPVPPSSFPLRPFFFLPSPSLLPFRLSRPSFHLPLPYHSVRWLLPSVNCYRPLIATNQIK